MSDVIETEETVAEVWGMKCPKCGDCDHICIAGTAWMTLTVDGTGAESDHEWTPASAARCEKCEFIGTVADFELDEGSAEMHETLENIAAHHLGFETLERRGRDRLDFKDVSVWQVMDALVAAYKAGKASGQE
jgi:hypothetical protein